jgi:hypothetical protein
LGSAGGSDVFRLELRLGSVASSFGVGSIGRWIEYYCSILLAWRVLDHAFESVVKPQLEFVNTLTFEKCARAYPVSARQ